MERKSKNSTPAIEASVEVVVLKDLLAVAGVNVSIEVAEIIYDNATVINEVTALTNQTVTAVNKLLPVVEPPKNERGYDPELSAKIMEQVDLELQKEQSATVTEGKSEPAKKQSTTLNTTGKKKK